MLHLRPAIIDLCRLALFLAAALFGCAGLQAQEDPAGGAAPEPVAAEPADPAYDQLKVDLSQSRKSTAIKAMVSAQRFANDDEKKAFDDYFKNFSLSRWTVLDDKTKIVFLDQAATKGYRKELRNWLATAKSGPVYDYLNDLVLAELGKMAAGNYQPAARYNAMLAIGDLNAIEVGTTETPKPLPKALAVMLSAVKDAKQADVVKVAALVGINRHVKLGAITDAPARASVVAEMAKLASAATPPKGRTLSGHAWMRSQAAEILGRLGVPGAKGEVVDALALLAADPTVPASPGDLVSVMAAKREAVRALGRIKYDDAARASAGKAVKAVAQYVLDAWKVEEESSELSRRRCKDGMAAAYFCITGNEFATKDPKEGLGLGAGASDAAGKKDVAALKPAIQSIMEALDDSGADELSLMSKIGDLCNKIQKVAPEQASEAAAPAENGKAAKDK